METVVGGGEPARNEEGRPVSTIDEFSDHFERQFQTLAGAYEKASQSAWTYQDIRVKGVEQPLPHALETIEFYLSEKTGGQFPWGHRFGVDWENERPDHVPSRDEMRAYQGDVEQLVRQVLSAKSDEDLRAPEAIAPWTGKLYLGKLLYLMRHTQQHIGDMNRVLRLNGDDALDWY
jgi:hypothetical protein